MKDFKIRVNEAQSRIVQETVFRNGGRWLTTKEVLFMTQPFLFLEDKILYWGDNEEYFNKDGTDELTFDQFQLEYNGILPEKWAVRWDNEEMFYACKEYFDGGWIYYEGSHCVSDGDHYWSFVFGQPTEYTLLTFDQFKKYVLKETINTNMKYKLVKKEYIDAVMGILYNKPSWLAIITDEIIIEDPENIQKLKDAGVLHWFEEVNDVSINGYKVERTSYGIKIGRKEFTYSFLQTLFSIEEEIIIIDRNAEDVFTKLKQVI